MKVYFAYLSLIIALLCNSAYSSLSDYTASGTSFKTKLDGYSITTEDASMCDSGRCSVSVLLELINKSISYSLSKKIAFECLLKKKSKSEEGKLLEIVSSFLSTAGHEIRGAIKSKRKPIVEKIASPSAQEAHTRLENALKRLIEKLYKDVERIAIINKGKAKYLHGDL